ncbi:Uncharacterized protein ACMD2_21813 [Ananas comosus]|uniref:Uncharacterized protein n=1 Tax=Ananas comosus TaxID=4615 RepID=A0A199VRS3_ANACO|nr:Uncharacterized protein ACMD2_21813 [Ananas comosus]
MLFCPFTSVTSAMSSSSSSSRILPPKRPQNPNPNPNSIPSCVCNHTPSAPLDLLILLLVLSSLAFLLASSLAHIARALSPSSPPRRCRPRRAPPPPGRRLRPPPPPPRGRRRRPRLRRRRSLPPAPPLPQPALPRPQEGARLQTEESLRSGGGGGGGGGGGDSASAAVWREIDALPWKGGQGGSNPDYECLRAELRKVAPPNGRAVLLFRARCGCPVTKLEAWGTKRGRRHYLPACLQGCVHLPDSPYEPPQVPAAARLVQPATNLQSYVASVPYPLVFNENGCYWVWMILDFGDDNEGCKVIVLDAVQA